MNSYTLPVKPPRWLTAAIALPLALWPMACMAATMAFDASGSEDNPFLLTFALAVMSYPLVIGGSWLLRRGFVSANMRKSAYAITLLPLLNIIAAATALQLLVTVCGGELVCR